jgi:hypothetical protein
MHSRDVARSENQCAPQVEIGLTDLANPLSNISAFLIDIFS